MGLHFTLLSPLVIERFHHTKLLKEGGVAEEAKDETRYIHKDERQHLRRQPDQNEGANEKGETKIFKEKGSHSGLLYPTGAFEERQNPDCDEHPEKPTRGRKARS